MYEKHAEFKAPEKCRDIWRYMDFVQFVNMLETKSLYFTRLDLLGDPHEGSFGWLKTLGDHENKDLKRKLEEGRKNMAVNCWHCSKTQSMAMWRLYARKCYGIAIKSTFDDLCKSITSPEKIYIGKVEYWDKEPSDLKDIGLYSGGVLHKRQCYNYEREVRSVVHKRSLFWEELGIWGFLDEGKKGVNIIVNLSVLIKKVYTCPDSPEWFYELVKNIVKKYGMNFEVLKSDLLEKPSY
jgi:hypothetical protein